MVLVNFPHNPTGYTPSREEFGKLVDVVRASGAILFSDEMYRFMDVDPSSACPSAVELYDRAVSLGGLSKSHSCPGLRCVHAHVWHARTPPTGQHLTGHFTHRAGAAGW